MNNYRENQGLPLLAYWALSTIAGCAADLQLPQGEDTSGAPVVTRSRGESEFVTQVNATDRDDWIFFRFATGEQVLVSPQRSDAGSGNEPSFEAPDEDWDLAFQRFHVRSNGGVTAPGNTQVAVLEGEEFEPLVQAPANGYLVDVEDSDDEDSVVDTPFATGVGWYNYDSSDNSLSPNDITYVVQTDEGAYFKMRFTDYYDAARSSGHPEFIWAPLASP